MAKHVTIDGKKVDVKRLFSDASKLVDYLWDDEQRHYLEQRPNDRNGHIFKTLKRLNKNLGLGLPVDKVE